MYTQHPHTEAIQHTTSADMAHLRSATVSVVGSQNFIHHSQQQQQQLQQFQLQQFQQQAQQAQQPIIPTRSQQMNYSSLYPIVPTNSSSVLYHHPKQNLTASAIQDHSNSPQPQNFIHQLAKQNPNQVYSKIHSPISNLSNSNQQNLQPHQQSLPPPSQYQQCIYQPKNITPPSAKSSSSYVSPYTSQPIGSQPVISQSLVSEEIPSPKVLPQHVQPQQATSVLPLKVEDSWYVQTKLTQPYLSTLSEYPYSNSNMNINANANPNSSVNAAVSYPPLPHQLSHHSSSSDLQIPVKRGEQYTNIYDNNIINVNNPSINTTGYMTNGSSINTSSSNSNNNNINYTAGLSYQLGYDNTISQTQQPLHSRSSSNSNMNLITNTNYNINQRSPYNNPPLAYYNLPQYTLNGYNNSSFKDAIGNGTGLRKRGYDEIQNFEVKKSSIAGVIYNSNAVFKRLKPNKNEEKSESLFKEETNRSQGRPFSSNLQCRFWLHDNLKSLLNHVDKKNNNEFIVYDMKNEIKLDNSNCTGLYSRLEDSPIYQVLLKNLQGSLNNDSILRTDMINDKLNSDVSMEALDKFMNCRHNDVMKVEGYREQFTPTQKNISYQSKNDKNKACGKRTINFHNLINEAFKNDEDYVFVKTIRDNNGHILKLETIKPPVDKDGRYCYTPEWVKRRICYPRYKGGMNLHLLSSRYNFVLYNDIKMLLWDIKEELLTRSEKELNEMLEKGCLIDDRLKKSLFGDRTVYT